MAKVLTKEDFEESGKDTSSKEIPADKVISADTKVTMDDQGRVIEAEEPEAKEVEAKGEEEPQPKIPEFKPKHKTWEETEKARIELEKEFTRKSMRASDLEKELETYKKPPPPPPSIDDEIAKITDEALNQIRAIPIDRDSEGKPIPESIGKYERESAIIWGKANRKISRLEIDEANKMAETERGTASKLYKKATDEGLRSDDELELLGYEYDRINPSLRIDDRIDKAIETTKNRLSRLREGFVKNQEKDKYEKGELQVLGRGSSRKEIKGKEKEEKPVSMSDQMADLNESRRLKKDDLWH